MTVAVNTPYPYNPPVRLPASSWTLYDLYNRMERPIVPLLQRMMDVGMRVDRTYMQALADRYGEEMVGHNAAAAELIGESAEDVNLGSDDQVRRALFGYFRLKPIKYTPTRQESTARDILDELAEKVPENSRAGQFLEHVREYRRYAKLKGTYADKIVELADDESRIYTTLKQTRAASGRLTSAEPFNFQNFPSRDIPGKPDEAKQFRQGFVPRPGYTWLKGDFSQIELRVAAHNAQDPTMMLAYILGEDIHTRTASEAWNIPAEQVSKDQRGGAKTVNFGALYGITAQGLMPKMPAANRTIQFCEWFLRRFWEVYSSIQGEVDRVHTFIRRHEGIGDSFGRWRWIPEVRSRINRVVEAGLREGFNHTIQGTAQGVIKLPMGETLPVLDHYGFDYLPLIQIHDEVDFEVRNDQVMAFAECFGNLYANAVSMDVPVVVEIEAGESWGDMHKILAVTSR